MDFLAGPFRDRRLLFAKQCIAKDVKMIKSLKYGPSRERPQHVVGAPGWGDGGWGRKQSLKEKDIKSDLEQLKKSRTAIFWANFDHTPPEIPQSAKISASRLPGFGNRKNHKSNQG